MSGADGAGTAIRPAGARAPLLARCLELLGITPGSLPAAAPPHFPLAVNDPGEGHSRRNMATRDATGDPTQPRWSPR